MKLKNIKIVATRDNMEQKELDQQILLTNILIRLATLEKLLFAKKIIAEEDFLKEITELTEKITESIKTKEVIKN
jgi:hypothetical protein